MMHPRVRMALMAAGTVALATALLVVLLVPSGGDSATQFEGASRPPGMPIRDYALHDQDGKAFRFSDSRGQVTVVAFLYSTCQDTCPLTAQQIALGLDRLGHRVPAIAVSVDPAHDTPALAKKFNRARLLDGTIRWGLGTAGQLAPVWKDFGVQPQGADFEHTAVVVLLDKQGRQRVSFPVDRLTPEGLADDVRRLEAEPAT